MTRKILAVLILTLASATLAQAQNTAGTQKAMDAQTSRLPPGMFIFDILLLRPLGVAATIAGSALFVGMSPLTAIANLPYPHNAFDRTANFLIRQPYKLTFERPLDVYPDALVKH